jgi:hypothetical protein
LAIARLICVKANSTDNEWCPNKWHDNAVIAQIKSDIVTEKLPAFYDIALLKP